MTKISLISTALILLCINTGASTLEAVQAGKKCERYEHTESTGCTYKVGKDLEFEIAGVGKKDASIYFTRGIKDGDYYMKFGVMHGCIIVSSGKNIADMAFVSPKNGKFYPSWVACSKAN